MSDDKGTADAQPAGESLDSILARSWGDEPEDSTEEESRDAPAPEESAEADEEAEDVPAEGSEDEPEASAAKDDDDESEETDDVPPLEAPQHWSRNDREVFSSLPRDGQEFLLRRHRDMEADYTRKSQEISEVRKAVDQFRPMLEQIGLSEAATVQQLLTAQYGLLTRPQEAIDQIARAYLGSDWLKKFTGDDADEEDDVDPRYARVVQELNDLKRGLQGQQYTAQQQQQAAAAKAIEAFRAETDEAGKPKHPHFDSVQSRMGKLIASGTAETLEDAYEQAVWADAKLRKQLLDEQQAQTKTKRKQAASQAKAKVLPKSKSAGETANTPKDLDSIIANAFEGLG